MGEARSDHRRASVPLYVGARLLAGVALVRWPRQTLTALGGRHPDEHATVYARVLGARHLAEALFLWRWTSPAALRVGATVDAIHGASAAALVVTGHHRRLATLNAGTALAWTGAGVALARELN
ncbi:MAG TPA: hypothetical protein VFN55_00825 [Solirubrobacteraceae bacterium]|nr:hypothetical protein [Solirubrobacteraceae bacterium]